VFGDPGDELSDEYQAFTGSVEPIPIGAISLPLPQLSFVEVAEGEIPRPLIEKRPEISALMLALKGEWQPCTLDKASRFVNIRQGGSKIDCGMSGSPILDANGAAVALISTGGGSRNLNPALMDCLPGWLLRMIDIELRNQAKT
jgi:hypothetical protein